ncbi:MAG: chemotaxis protein CheW [Acidimicrobiales bacterium]
MTIDPETAEILSEFVVESRENLDSLDRDLLAIEDDPSRVEQVNSAFRSLHTIKGTAGFVGLDRVEALAHAGESLLSRLRDGLASVTAEQLSALLATVDMLRILVAAVERGGTDEVSGVDHTELVRRLGVLAESPPAAPPGEHRAILPPEPEVGGGAVPTVGASGPAARVLSPVPAAEADRRAEPSATPPGPAQAPPDGAGADQEADRPAGEHPQPPSQSAETSVRVDVGLLDRLMNLVGELVLARNQLLQHTGDRDDSDLSVATQRLSLITTELQESVMKTRMQPIGNVWSKFPRMVRDLAQECAKEVRLVTEGRETELDRTIIEAVKDPLTHLVRNAVDHGIEATRARSASGKPAQGTVTLRAYHEGGYVTIEVSDDGAGIDPEALRERAAQRGLVRREQLDSMADRDVMGLIFMPGFSTAPSVSSVSGRGVGMDVVKTHVERIGGTVDLTSAPGEGTTFYLKIPLTLAIIPALIVSSGGERYAIPQVSLLELLRYDGDEVGRAVEEVGGVPVCRRRGSLLPLVHLAAELGTEERPRIRDARVLNVVVLQIEEEAFGLVVDGISDSEEIVVKPLRGALRDIPAFAGATIMGDGRVALILDVVGIAQRSGVVAEARRMDLAEDLGREVVDRRRTLLVLAAGERGRLAVPLDQVARLETFAAEVIEQAGFREVAQYRGHLLPLVRLSGALGLQAAPGGQVVEVVVVSAGGREVGVVVDGILDIVEQEVDLEPGLSRSAVLGSAVIDGRATEVVDLTAVVRSSDPALLELEGATA